MSRLSDETRASLGRWAENAGCRLLVLFGSAASADGGESRRPRDVDLALAFRHPPPPAERLRIIGELQDRVGVPDVDVVFLHDDTDPVLRFEIFKQGVPLYEAEEGLFVSEVLRALALYEDAIPFRRALIERLRRKHAG